MELGLFDEVGEALMAFLPSDLGPLRRKAHRYGIKVWFGPKTPPSEHYEAQVIGARDVTDATVLAIEVGFHAEHPNPDDNVAALAPILRKRTSWQRALGPKVVAGSFLGTRDDWQRVSETWADPDLDEPDLALELATRLTDYITVLEPLRRA